MASLPARQASQRRPSPEQNSSAQTQSQSPVRTRSGDSQTLFLNKPELTQEQEQSPEQEAQPQQPSATESEPQQQQDGEDSSVKKCWICFSDSTEDTPTTSPWRAPCPCALVAHEECLLDWIADMESPTNTRRNNRGGASLAAPPIQCPQCKAEIKLARPRNVVVEAIRGFERLGSQLITPGALTVLFGTVYNSSMAWGVHSIYAVFGSEDGFRILRPLILNHVRPPLEFENGTPREIGTQMLALALDHVVHWRLYVGLPLITPMIILSRTRLADSVLPVLPILFFATQTHFPDENGLDFGTWPPSASLAFAILPYLRSAYNIGYQKVWAEKEKRWLKELQPRLNQQAANDGAAGAGAENAGGQDDMDAIAARDDDENVFEVRIDGGIWEDWEEGDSSDEEDGGGVHMPEMAPPPAAAQPDPQHGQQEGQQNDDQPQPAQQEEQQQPAQNQPPAAPQAAGAGAGGGERRLSFSPTAIAETVLGALLFPAVAGMSGELLKLALPRSWTTPSPSLSRVGGRVAARGLLQEKWGRSLVGGCLFVVLKDAVMLYVRWKMVQMHRQRRVVDWEGKKKVRS